jgi:GxxExxY protein
LIHELSLRGIASVKQKPVLIRYKDAVREEPLRFDILVEDCLLVEVKAIEAVEKIHKAKTLSYIRLIDVPLGLVIIFHELRLVDGVNRVMLHGASGEDELNS